MGQRGARRDVPRCVDANSLSPDDIRGLDAPASTIRETTLFHVPAANIKKNDNANNNDNNNSSNNNSNNNNV